MLVVGLALRTLVCGDGWRGSCSMARALFDGAGPVRWRGSCSIARALFDGGGPLTVRWLNHDLRLSNCHNTSRPESKIPRLDSFSPVENQTLKVIWPLAHKTLGSDNSPIALRLGLATSRHWAPLPLDVALPKPPPRQ